MTAKENGEVFGGIRHVVSCSRFCLSVCSLCKHQSGFELTCYTSITIYIKKRGIHTGITNLLLSKGH